MWPSWRDLFTVLFWPSNDDYSKSYVEYHFCKDTQHLFYFRGTCVFYILINSFCPNTKTCSVLVFGSLCEPKIGTLVAFHFKRFSCHALIFLKNDERYTKRGSIEQRFRNQDCECNFCGLAVSWNLVHCLDQAVMALSPRLVQKIRGNVKIGFNCGTTFGPTRSSQNQSFFPSRTVLGGAAMWFSTRDRDQKRPPRNPKDIHLQKLKLTFKM